MKIIFTLITLICMTQIGFSSKDTLVTYYNRSWNQCGKKDADYIVKSFQLEDGTIGIHKTYKSGTYIEKGAYKTADLTVKHGFFQYFGAFGILYAEGSFEENIREGEWKFYSNRNTLSSKGTYKLGQKNGSWEYYDDRGHLNKKCTFTEDQYDGDYIRWEEGKKVEEGKFMMNKEIGEWTGWYKSGKVEYKNFYSDLGLRIGEWIYYYENGQIAEKATFSQNEEKRLYYNEAGIAVEFEGVDFIEAAFPGGQMALYEFIRQKMEYPFVALNNHEQGTVYVQFTVMRDGSITAIKIGKGVSELLDAEAIRVISLMPDWTPEFYYGRKVKGGYTLPIKFTLD